MSDPTNTIKDPPRFPDVFTPPRRPRGPAIVRQPIHAVAEPGVFASWLPTSAIQEWATYENPNIDDHSRTVAREGVGSAEKGIISIGVAAGISNFYLYDPSEPRVSASLSHRFDVGLHGVYDVTVKAHLTIPLPKIYLEGKPLHPAKVVGCATLVLPVSLLETPQHTFEFCNISGEGSYKPVEDADLVEPLYFSGTRILTARGRGNFLPGSSVFAVVKVELTVALPSTNGAPYGFAGIDLIEPGMSADGNGSVYLNPWPVIPISEQIFSHGIQLTKLELSAIPVG